MRVKEHRALYCDNTPDTFSKLSYVEKSRVDELDTAIATLINLPSAEPRWIPCSERLPNGGHNVLMCRKNGTVGEGCYHSIIGEWSQFRWNAIGVKDVIAWMPLPEPYGGESDES